jgi:hypothetical protein
MPPEPRSVGHIAGNWRITPFFQESEADQIQRNLDLLTHEERMKPYRFAEPWPADIKDKIHKLYKNDVKVLSGGKGCMLAAYKCLETIHPGQPKRATKDDPGRDALMDRVFDNSTEATRSVDKMMETLQKDGMAGEPLTVNFKKGSWTPSPDEEVLKMFDHKQEGVYLFGVSVSKGFHTVILAVDNTPQPEGKPPGPRVYWLDQASGGLVKDVTGQVGQRMSRFGTNPSRIWPLRPEQISRNPP